MNRIIKFRGLAVSSGEMVYGCLIKKRYNALADWMIEDENGLGSDVVTESIGQFTGLFDKNRVEVFEGDILNIGADDGFGYIKNGNGNNANYEVKIEGCDYILYRNDIKLKWGRLSRLDEMNWNCKVIGNIHQNKELLNAQN